MKLLRVGGVDETVSTGGVISLAFGNSMSSCNPACNRTRLSCVAALGRNEAGEMMSRSGAAASAGSPSATTPKTIRPIKRKPGRCMISQRKASVLQRRCALMEELICFFTVVPSRLLGIFGKQSVACTGARIVGAARFYQQTRGMIFMVVKAAQNRPRSAHLAFAYSRLRPCLVAHQPA